MLPYLSLNIMISYLNIFRNYNKDSKLIFSLIKYNVSLFEIEVLFCLLIIGIFMGVRGNFTQDYDNYIFLFNYTIDRTFEDVIFYGGYEETGFLLFNKVIGMLTQNPHIYMFIVSFIFVSLVLLVSCKLTHSVFMFSLFFVNAGIFFLSFNMLRQALASAIVLLAIYFLINNNRLYYFLLSLLASTFHITAITALVLYPFIVQDINAKNIIKFLMLCILSFILLDRIISIVQVYRYANYNYGMEEGKVTAFIVQWSICLFSWMAILLGKSEVINQKYKILINCSFLYVLFSVLTLKVYQMSRLSYLFSTPMLILAADVFYQWKSEHSFMCKVAANILLIIYSYIWLSGTDYNPYFTFFK